MYWSNRLLILVLSVLMLMPSFPLDAQEDMEESHRQMVLRVVQEAFNQGDLDVIDDVFAPDYVNHDTAGHIVDRESLKAFISAFRAAMPDLNVTVDMLIVDGDWMSFRLISKGTFRHELSLFAGVPPTDETVEMIKHATIRFNEEGQIVEEWGLIDNEQFLIQMGILPPMEATSTEIFAIGQEDWRWSDFRSSGLSETTEFNCTVGIDCSTELFPQSLNRAGLEVYQEISVEQVVIQFNLEQSYNYVILRLAKAGSETVVVTVDGEFTYHVTGELVGSGEGGRMGAYNLRLGALTEGTHTIQLTVADDGIGNGSFGWDALSLFAM